MLLLLTAAEEAHPDYDDTLLVPAIVLFAIALLYAIVATWIVTPKTGHE